MVKRCEGKMELINFISSIDLSRRVSRSLIERIEGGDVDYDHIEDIGWFNSAYVEILRCPSDGGKTRYILGLFYGSARLPNEIDLNIVQLCNMKDAKTLFLDLSERSLEFLDVDRKTMDRFMGRWKDVAMRQSLYITCILMRMVEIERLYEHYDMV